MAEYSLMCVLCSVFALIIGGVLGCLIGTRNMTDEIEIRNLHVTSLSKMLEENEEEMKTTLSALTAEKNELYERIAVLTEKLEEMRKADKND